VLGFTVLISLLAAIVFGLAPALQASRADLNHILKEGGRSGASGPGQSRTRKVLVTVETAVAFVLLMGAGLMLKSFWNLQHANAGIRPDHVLTFHLRLPTDTMYKTREQQREFIAQVLNRVQSMPGIQSAGMTDIVPFSQESSRASFRIEHQVTPPHQELMADFRRASPSFFETMGIPLIKGRYFTPRDNENSPLVAVVDESFARRYWPSDNPIGKRLILAGSSREVVGVAGPVKHYGLDKPARPAIYLPLLQLPSERLAIAVRSTLGHDAITSAVKNAVWSVDTDQPVFLVRTMDEYISISNSAPRLTLILLGIFAAVALLLAALGIYGVVAYTVSQRTHEFGLRIALGAKPSDVKNHVIREGFVTAAIGLAAGVAASLALAPVIGSFLYGVSAIDPSVFVWTTIPLLLVALAANYIPASRATRIDPMVALRYE
jgi:putative ABC transport system permease protein